MGASMGTPGSQPVIWTVTAIFDDPEAAQSAIDELRGQGIAASDISMSVQDRQGDENTGSALDSAEGASRQEIGTSNTYRVSPELPNDEDLPSTQAYMTDDSAGQWEVPVVIDHDIPPDEPMGGGLRLGINKTGYDEVEPAEHDMVRRVDADADADVDIYTDFPDQPGGLSPDAPLAGAEGSQGGSAEGHSPNSGLPPARGEGATVSVSTDDAQRDFVSAILEAHGGNISTSMG
jgi:hypothetical protein